MKKLKLPEEYAAVLKLVWRTGQEDFMQLAESLRMSQARLIHVVQSLKHKGLISINRSTYSEGWIKLSAKGRRLVRFTWPDVAFAR